MYIHIYILILYSFTPYTPVKELNITTDEGIYVYLCNCMKLVVCVYIHIHIDIVIIYLKQQ
jgi:hypothetical protein